MDSPLQTFSAPVFGSETQEERLQAHSCVPNDSRLRASLETPSLEEKKTLICFVAENRRSRKISFVIVPDTCFLVCQQFPVWFQ